MKQSITSRVPEAEPWGGHAEPQTPVASCASTNLDLKGVDIDLSSLNNTNTDSNKTGLSNDGFDSNATYQNYSSPGTSPNLDDENVGMISDNNTSKSATPTEVNVNPRKGRPF